MLRYLLLACICTAAVKLCTNFRFTQVRNQMQKDLKQKNECLDTAGGKHDDKDLPQLPSAEFYIRMLSTRSPPRGDPFDPQINATELRATLKLLWKFLDLCESHGIQVMLYGGTLLGSYRHHGIIPWDDDVDLLMKVDDTGRLKEALKGHSDLRLREAGRWKVSSKSDCLNTARHGCWPFIDLSFYKLEDGWVIDVLSAFGRPYRYPENYTLPLHKRPFMGRWIDSPRDALNFLAYAIKPTAECDSLHYSHKFERYPKVPKKTVNCRALGSTYPFVFRIPDVVSSCRGALETMRFSNGGPMYTVLVNEPMNVINDDFSTTARTDRLP